MNIGVIGLGSIGERHVRNIQAMYPRASIEILTKRTHWKDAGKDTQLTASPAQFYKTQHDVYFITNETNKHTETILRCLKQKPKGLFVEKPLCHTGRDILRLRAALKKYPTIFFVAYCLQFSKPLMSILREMRKKSPGRILSMRVSVGKDLRDWRTSDYKKRYSAHRDQGGGVTLDLIHELNYPSWILNEPLDVITGVSKRISLPIDAEDITEGILESKSGTIVSTHQDYLQVPGRRYAEIVGSDGTLLWDDSGTITLRTATRTRTIKVREDRNEMYKRELMWFISAMRKGVLVSNFDEAARDVRNARALKRL